MPAQSDLGAPRSAHGSTSHLVRNGSGQVIEEASADPGTTVYYGDARGLVTQSIDGRSLTTIFTYDSAGRMLTRKPAENIIFTWDQTAPI